MKKVLSAFLAIILVCTGILPAYAESIERNIVAMCTYRSLGEFSPYSIDDDVEYEAVRFSPEKLRDVKLQVKEASDKLEKCQRSFSDANASYVKLNDRVERATSVLYEFDGVILPKNEIGDDRWRRWMCT